MGTAALASVAPRGSVQVNNSLTANAGNVGTGGTISLQAIASRSADGKVPELPASVLVGTANDQANLRAEGGTTSGDGGTIDIGTNGAIFLNSNFVSVNARGNGSGGNITVRLDSAPVADDGGGIIIGALAVEENSVILNGSISANGSGNGNGGNINVTTVGDRSLIQINPGSRFTAKSGAGDSNGGTISLVTDAPLILNHTVILNANALGAGNGGQVDITASSVIETASRVSANSSTGKGGLIRIIAGQNLSVSDGPITANGQEGGEVILESGTSGLGNLSINTQVQANSADSSKTGSIHLATAAESGGSITLNGDISAKNGSVEINVDGTGAIVQDSGEVISKSLNLVSGNGDIGSSSKRLSTEATKVGVQSEGKVYLELTKSAILMDTTAGDLLDIRGKHGIRTGDLPSTVTRAKEVYIESDSNEGITVNSAITGETSVIIDATKGDVVLERGSVEATDLVGRILLSGENIMNSFSPSAENVLIRANSNVVFNATRGSIGSADSPIRITTATAQLIPGGTPLRLNATSDVYALTRGDATIAFDSAAGRTFSVLTSKSGDDKGNLAVGARISAQNVILKTGINPVTLMPGGEPHNANVTLSVQIAASQSISITTTGSGNIQQTLPPPFLTLVSPTIELKSDYGSIGTILSVAPTPVPAPDDVLPLMVRTTNLKVTTGNNPSSQDVGIVNVANFDPLQLTPLTVQASEAGGEFSLASTGPLKLHGISAGGEIRIQSLVGPLQVMADSKIFSAVGSIGLVANTNAIEIHSGANIGTLNGNVILLAGAGQVLLGDPGNSKPTFITAAAVADSTGGLGNVIIQAGTGTSNLVPADNSVPNLSVLSIPPEAGFVRWTENKVKAPGPSNSATAANRFVILNAVSPNLRIRFNGNVNVQAIGQPVEGLTTPPTIPSSLTEPLSIFNPIGFTQLVSIPLWQKAILSKNGKVFSKAASLLQTGVKNFELKSGSAVFCAEEEPMVIKVQDIVLALMRGSVAFVSFNEEFVVVHQMHGQSRATNIKGSQATATMLIPGQETIFTKNQRCLQSSPLIYSIPRRKTLRQTDGEYLLVSSEYSVSSLISSTGMMELSHHSEFWRTFQKVLKTAACLSIVTGKHGPYRKDSL